MIEDIVARLRTADAGLRREITSIPADAPSLLLEAAAEIEQLRNDVDLLRAGLAFEKRISRR